MKRKTGYYWIKRHDKSDWEPATYLQSHEAWEVFGYSTWLSEEDIHEVRKNEFGIEQAMKVPE